MNWRIAGRKRQQGKMKNVKLTTDNVELEEAAVDRQPIGREN